MSQSDDSGGIDARPALVVFRDDLRLVDNPALAAAVRTGRPVAALFVLDEVSEGVRPLGGASRWWLHHSLVALARDLATHGVRLVLRRGGMAQVVDEVARAIDAAEIVWNRRYGAAEQAVDAALKAASKARGVTATSFNAALLREPWEIRTAAGQPFRVFTPFWRAARQHGPFRSPMAAPDRIVPYRQPPDGDELAAWGLLPRRPDWAGGLRATWVPGEAGAQHRLEQFLDGGLTGYATRRNRPDLEGTSRLSPHLRFGEISPVQVVHAVETAQAADATGASRADVDKFLAEIGWREFAHHLLGQFPSLGADNFEPRFDAFPWRNAPAHLEAWQRGRTGYPIVDAGMRQLWLTGWMHNRVRMIVASFLVKHLLVHWREGERWFWDTLVDADAANNAAGWQWVAGTGADAAPFFRIFNPVLQGEKFDPDGAYVRRFVPELERLPTEVLHRPWTASAATLHAAGVRLGETYPEPIVDHAAARAAALQGLARIRATR